MNKVKVDYEELKDLISFLSDKVEDCYKREVKDLVESYLSKIEKDL